MKKLVFACSFFFIIMRVKYINLREDYIMSGKINATVKKITAQLNFVKDFYFSAMGKTAKYLAKIGVSANVVSVFGFAIGLFAINFLAMGDYFSALVCVLLNRFLDGVDGVLARQKEVTDFGVFLDACLDYAVYAGIIFGFGMANPSANAVAAGFWLFGFTVSATSMLAYAVVSYKNYCDKASEKKKLPIYLGGFFQGFETLAGVLFLCLMPGWFTPVAIILGCFALAKALMVVSVAYYNLVILNKNK